MQPRYEFASDNTSGLSPTSLDAIVRANAGYHAPYGDDRFTAEATDAFRALFETDCDVYFVFNGTAANSLALASLCQSYHSVIVSGVAHVETDECGAPEFFSNGTKILLADHEHAKLDPASVERLVTRRSDIHYPRPRVLSLSQATEAGTVYTAEEVHTLATLAQRLDLNVHMDGARLANAVAALGVAPAEVTWRAGVDVVCVGGTKNGIGASEAVVFFDRELSREFAYRCKQAGQLASKMWLMAAPWAAALRDGGWLENARHANAMAARLEAAVRAAGLALLHPRQANAVFVDLPETVHERLFAQGWRYYRFIGGGARFMCSWRTTPEDVDALAESIRGAAGA